MLALKLDADGCYLGQKDMNIKTARKMLDEKIIGITCHNSMNLAKALKLKLTTLPSVLLINLKLKKQSM